MRHLLAATCLTPVALCAFALPLHAETVVNDARTAPLLTSTANDDIVAALVPESTEITRMRTQRPIIPSPDLRRAYDRA